VQWFDSWGQKNVEPRERQYLGLSAAGFHRNCYWEWHSALTDAPILIAMHGLTRNGRDFDTIAQGLTGRFQVICPDVVGRGKSDWLPDGALYSYPQYLGDAAALIARVAAGPVDWLGTSMGGLVGMMLAAQPLTPIRRLIVNDVGPFVPKESLERIGAYAGADPRFADLAELEVYIRRVYADFGNLSDADWAHMVRHSARPRPDGGYGLAYDPAIADSFKAGPMADVDLWPIWERIQCPVLVLRGARSDLLLPETAARMAASRPNVTLVELPDCGHAPALMDEGQIGVVRDWLERTAP
jgi:pimeloyl-ACP methyl ester carboxylesterase